jgi:hypothetical protein
VDGPISVRVYFGRRAPTVIPACLRKISPSKGRASCGISWGGVVSSPSSSSSSSYFKDSDLEGVSASLALTAIRAALHACLLCLHAHNHFFRV